MEKRKCGWKGCKTEIKLDTSFEKTSSGKAWGVIVVGWCKIHSDLYHKQTTVFASMVDEYNKKQIKNKFGRIIRFAHHSDVSNYLYQYDKKEYNKIIKGIKI